ncbi:PhzF family phenazine biosynthesis protein [Aquimonas sp.]|jgi:PhzF family phenazine biosynthesis protein|uniref:PhzF family phenazine biosynthesis protein n=1 Tax=Aquimonas sp. TaxID=1872588 RepID=UPI0037BF46ED
MRCPLIQVDVFGCRPFGGNPVAVIFVADPQALDAVAMQRIAHWTNLSETTFVLPPSAPGASYRLRIFTPRQELPFAGHPSIGSAHAVLESGWAQADADGRLLQECAAGLLPLRVEGEGESRRLFVRLPAPEQAPLSAEAQATLERALDAPITAAAAVNVGPVWIVAGLANGAAVRALQPDLSALAQLSLATGAVGISVYGPDETGEADLVVRSFVPADGIPEDPVCGSGNGAIGAYLQARDSLPGRRYVVSQGRECGHDGRVEVELDADDRLWIGGQARTCIRGEIEL